MTVVVLALSAVIVFNAFVIWAGQRLYVQRAHDRQLER
jgi:hypothetical protein